MEDLQDSSIDPSGYDFWAAQGYDPTVDVNQYIDPTGSAGTNTGDQLAGMTGNSAIDGIDYNGILDDAVGPQNNPIPPGGTILADSGNNCVDPLTNQLVDCQTGAPATSAGPNGTRNATGTAVQGAQVAGGIGGLLSGIGTALGSALRGFTNPAPKTTLVGAQAPATNQAGLLGGLGSGGTGTIIILAVVVLLILKSRQGGEK